MLKRNRMQLLLALIILSLLAVACNATAPLVQEVDREALVAEAVATIQAQQAADAAEAEVIAVVNEAVAVETSSDAMSPFELQDTLVALYERVNPAVVYISIRVGGFEVGNGSGFVYDNTGHIITNNHVVADGEGFEVTFGNGAQRSAEIVGTDVDSDLAVIKVDDMPEGIVPLALSDLDETAVGQFVIAIGSPFQQENSMSLGIVSALGRDLRSQRLSEASGGFYSLPQVIQTDAPINPGNSGGPLLNLDGEVVGVNSAINTATGVNSGVGFAIPVNAVKRIAPALIEIGSYTYPYMGVGIGSVDVTTARQLGLDEARGALVSRVTPGSPADAANLRDGDVIIRIDDKNIDEFADLNSYLVFETSVGQTIEIEAIRNGEILILPLDLGARP